MHRRLLVVSLLLALLALVAGTECWLSLASDTAQAPWAGRERVSQSPPNGPELQGAAHEDGSMRRERAPGTVPVEAPPAPNATDALATLPPDPLEQGTCSLTLVCTDEAGSPAPDLRVQLWRMSAPANEHWLAGDQRQGMATTQGGRATWSDLPAGRYRVFVPRLRAQAEDPPAFEVAGAHTSVALVCPLARCVALRVSALDEHGVPLTEARSSLIGTEKHMGLWEPPPWITARQRRTGELPASSRRRARASSGPAGLRVRAGPAGFEIGTCCEATRGDVTGTWRGGLELAGRTGITLEVAAADVQPPAPLDYVGLSVPLELITSRVWLPGGRLARDAGARFDAACRAVAAPGPNGTLDPLSLPVHVTVSLQGYAPLQFEFLLAERWREHTLEPVPSASAPGPR